jgi:hypothetical protein
MKARIRKFLVTCVGCKRIVLNQMKYMIKSTSLALALGAFSVFSLSAQPVLETVQQFVIGPQLDGWSFNFQLSRFLPSSPSDTLVKIEIILSVNTTYPQFTVTASKDNSVANWDVSETVTVKNLKFNADDGCDDDQDDKAVKEVEASTELTGSSSPLMSGASQTINGGTLTTTQPTIMLTSPDDLQRFTGDTNSPKAINIKIVNKQSRSFTFKPGDGTFNPARKDYHPTTGATLTVNYYTSTSSDCPTVQNNYSVNSAYLIVPSVGTYSSNTHP